MAVLTLSGLFKLNVVSSSTSAAFSLQDWFDQNGYAINVTTDETSIETFPAGYYKLDILAELAAYAPKNNLTWYPASDGQLHYIFYGENTTGNTTYFIANESFGLCLCSPDGYFYTESIRNEDGKDHALIFMNPNASGYIIAWEDLWDLGDEDFVDLILAEFTPVNVNVRYFPRTLNLKSKGRWITTIIRFPHEFEAKDVDVSSIRLNGTVSADLEHYLILDWARLHLLVLKVNRTAIIEFIENSLETIDNRRRIAQIALTVTGNFLDGTPFQGTNRIRIIRFTCPRSRHQLLRKAQYPRCIWK